MGARGPKNRRDQKVTGELRLADALAAARTKLAAERTLMGWVRTAISLITFGFTLDRALQFAVEEGALPRIRSYATENVALILISLGTVSLALATYQHWRFVQSLPPGGTGTTRWDLTLSMAGLIVLLGLLILVNVLFRVGPL